MGLFDRLFGGGDDSRQAPPVAQNTARVERGQASAHRDAAGGYAPPPQPGQGSAPSATSEDEAAIERYRYLLRTAPPETIEQVHAEAFSKLTDSQRHQVLADLSSSLPVAERPASDDPQAMARAATRAEYSQPGFMERTFGGRSFARQGGPGFGSMLGASVLGTIGGYVIGSALVSSFMAPSFANEQGSADGTGDAGAEDAGGDAGADVGGEAAGGDFGGGDFGGGGFGDFGGGDFGGGDFGGF